jgi:hypothetical protein
MMQRSKFANRLVCQHCGEANKTDRWPALGDAIPLYFQSEPGRFQIPVSCPKCGKEWYVVWDQDPGQIEELDSAAEPPAPKPEQRVQTKFDLFTSKKTIPAGTIGIVKQAYPGGLLLVEFPSLGISDEWMDDVFIKAPNS